MEEILFCLEGHGVTLYHKVILNEERTGNHELREVMGSEN